MTPNKPNSPFAPMAAGFLIGAITAGAVFLFWNHDKPSHSHRSSLVSDTGTIPAITPAPDAAVTRVAARFACSCGTCGEQRLDICSCETAQKERAFIQEQLRNGLNETEAAEAVKQKYGGLKS